MPAKTSDRSASVNPTIRTPLAFGHRRAARGFTLIELMIVVAMIGVLAALAIAGYRKYIHSSQSTEATAVLQSIRGSQEAYKVEALAYLNVSEDSLDELYPREKGALDDRKAAWLNETGNHYDNWRLLNASTDGAVRFGYACIAGLPGTEPPGAVHDAPNPNWASTYGGGDSPQPWFVAVAVGDRDNDDDKYAVLQASSLSNEVMVHEDTE
jgi:type IV pilus assembly protein PilA